MSATLNVVGGHLYLEREGTVLLEQRSPSAAFGAGEWHALAGHVERQAVRACVVRDAQEEAGLSIDAEGLLLVHTVHPLDSPEAVPRLQLFFQPRRWTGEPQLLKRALLPPARHRHHVRTFTRGSHAHPNRHM